MLFVCTIKSTPGNYSHSIKTLKHPKIPEGIEVKYFLGMFGRQDFILVFEAKDEKTASDFVIQFGQIGEVFTSLAIPIEELKWTV